jgi:hypothetical protein
MKKALVLCFSVDKYTQEIFREMTSEELYEEAKTNLESGETDIYTLEDFCFDINNGEDVLTEWFVYPHYIEEDEYKSWYK